MVYGADVIPSSFQYQPGFPFLLAVFFLNV
jgi:hypothetical protein